MRWRTGRSVGRTIYEQVGDEPADADRLIGMMDTAELAAAAVDAFNLYQREFGARQCVPWRQRGW